MCIGGWDSRRVVSGYTVSSSSRTTWHRRGFVVYGVYSKLQDISTILRPCPRKQMHILSLPLNSLPPIDARYMLCPPDPTSQPSNPHNRRMIPRIRRRLIQHRNRLPLQLRALALEPQEAQPRLYTLFPQLRAMVPLNPDAHSLAPTPPRALQCKLLQPVILSRMEDLCRCEVGGRAEVEV